MHKHNGRNGTGVYCSCGHEELMMVVIPGEGVEVKARRHGENHVAFLNPSELLGRLAGTYGREAILRFVGTAL